ncbi:sugar phosphate isomerase/epimerase family protein [Saccharicrinis carchari]|nr:sugar phosphate isomerase/epimerase [Saccharicrinis carchari]
MKTRREFLKITAAGSASMLLLGPLSACASSTIDRKSYGVGLQLYTIRDAIKADLQGSLKKVSDLGYKYLELANYADGKFYGLAPAEFKKMVSDLGMETISSHTQVEAKGITLDNAKRMAEAHARMDVKYCVQPWVNQSDRNVETYKRLIEEWNKVGGIMKDVGIQFGYHNHDFEFEPMDGIVPYYDLFMPRLDPDLVTMELDVFWAHKAGHDPVEIFEKYPGRFQLLHIKDMRNQEDSMHETKGTDMCSVGEGVIDFKRIMEARDVAGTQYIFVEDDSQGNGRPFEGIESSIKNLTTHILKS